MRGQANPEIKTFTLAGLGEILWDELPDGRRLGGAPANFAYHAHKQGVRGVILSRIGNDPDGGEIIQTLERIGLEANFIMVDKFHPTGRVSVSLNSRGVPDYTIHENAAWDFMEMIPRLLDFAGTIQGLCFGSLAQRSPVSRFAIRAFLKAAPRDCLKIFDVNLRQNFYTSKILMSSLAASNVLKLNQEELDILTEILPLKGGLDDRLMGLLERFELDLVALTRGAEGSRLLTAGEISDHPGFSVTIRDTVGAGDAFAAALAVGLLHGSGLEELNEAANRLAARVCTQSGAWWTGERIGEETENSV